MTDIGPVEQEMRDRAKQVRQRFFARPENDNAAPKANPLLRTVSTADRIWPPKPAPVLPMVRKPIQRDYMNVASVDPCGRQAPEIIRRRVERIVLEVSAKNNVSAADMISGARFRYIARARHEAMWRVRKELRLSTPEIGRHFKRDHSTIVHALRAHEKRMAREQETSVGFEAVE